MSQNQRKTKKTKGIWERTQTMLGNTTNSTKPSLGNFEGPTFSRQALQSAPIFVF
jgi:hypothetical protein